MEERLRIGPGIRGCPFALPAIPSTDSVGFYCRMPGGRVRMPTPDERIRFCASGRYDDCPVIRRYVH